MGYRSRTAFCAEGLFVVGSLLVLISFVSPYWLQSDGNLPNPKFVRLGLWEVCFKNFMHPKYWYTTVFNTCWWIFEEEYYIIYDFLLPGFFVATQFFFTVSFTLCILPILVMIIFWLIEKDTERYIIYSLTQGGLIVGAGLSGLIAVIIFGSKGDSRYWMPDWEHNSLGWAYVLGVLGILTLFPSGILFLIEARVKRYKRLNEIHSREQSAYDLPERKVRYGGQTDI